MCGRYASKLPPEYMRELFQTEPPLIDFKPVYNAAPSLMLPVVRYNPETKTRHLDLLRWGLVPRWAKDINVGYKMINARCETVAEKAAFKDAFIKRRCLVPASAFYEWKPVGKRKQPYAIALKSGEPLAFAGLWEACRLGSEIIRSFTIVVTGANDLVAPIHDRMPVIVPPRDWPAWLGENPADHSRLQAIMGPYPAEEMTAWPVSARVSSPKNDDPGLLEPLAAEPTPITTSSP